MKELLNFIGFMVMFFLIYAICIGIKIHSLDETHMDKSFAIKDAIYVLPDSTKGMVEGGYVVTQRLKDKVTKVKKNVTLYELYTIIYTDKNGVIQRLKNIKPDLLIKRND